ncbi:hypothetical protein LNK20_08380 [Bacillus safensis]|uniref:XtrA/YqaO family protein n=1 Tax=Bacillus TaxID=1386 RepID=UPI001FF9E443|nr:XtrA/YqaO family protein [Bacillus safensis]MCK1972725.1 hypothetical protein [Bacillus safensis]
MNLPIEIITTKKIEEHIEFGRVKLLILDGLNHKAYLSDIPDYGKTSIHSKNGLPIRIQYDYGYKLM